MAVGDGVPVFGRGLVCSVLGALVGATEFCLLCASAQANPVGTEILRVCTNRTSKLLHNLAGFCGHVLPKAG